ncbi:MAG: DUF1499 domain-containing protein [Hyphomicrobiales bacterium]|nr:DUF1499 domain-containing protein [Hyphomicrobiales bacterium]
MSMHAPRTRHTLAIATVTLVAALVLAVLAAGQLHLLDRLYESLFGPPDLGEIAFETITRRAAGNDALACPPATCGSARVDVVPSNYAAAAGELRRRVRRYFATQGGVLVGSDETRLHDRFVVRTRFLRFPDTVDVEIVPVDADHATLAVYSRSQLGNFDLGTNLRRVRALLDALGPGVASAARDVWRA